MTDLSVKEFELAAQEMAMHMALCVCAEYIQSWGMTEFLDKLSTYSNDTDVDECLYFLQDGSDNE